MARSLKFRSLCLNPYKWKCCHVLLVFIFTVSTLVSVTVCLIDAIGLWILFFHSAILVQVLFLH